MAPNNTCGAIIIGLGQLILGNLLPRSLFRCEQNKDIGT